MNADEIAAGLRRRIVAGRLPPAERPPDALPPGFALPTVRGFADELGVSPETIHKAYRQLSDGGLIHTRSGRTSIVADHRPLLIITERTYDRSVREDPSGRTVYESQALAAGLQPRTVHHYDETPVPCPDWAAELFDAEPGIPVIRLWGEGFATPLGADGEPAPGHEYVAGIYECHVPVPVAEQVPQLLTTRDDAVKDQWIGGVWSVVAWGLSVDLVRGRQVIYGVQTTEEESGRFGLPRSVPVMVEETAHGGADGRVLVVSRMLKLFGSAKYDFRLSVEP